MSGYRKMYYMPRQTERGRYMPENRYADNRYPENRYPENRYPENRYPENRYRMSYYQPEPDYRYTGQRIGFSAGPGNGPHEYEYGGTSYEEEPLSELDAQEWTQGMTGGAHWSMAQTEKIMVQRGMDCDPVEFFAVMNALHSDYSDVFKKYGVNNNTAFYADLAKAWIDDDDAVENKAAMYYRYIVKK